MAGGATRWARSSRALWEFAVLAAATVVTLGFGIAVVGGAMEPMRKVSCADIVRFELAVPDETPQVGLRSFADLRDECADRLDLPDDGDREGAAERGARQRALYDSLAGAIESSTRRDFVFIPMYVALLAWAAARVGGMRMLRPQAALPVVGAPGWSRLSRFWKLFADTPAERDIRDVVDDDNLSPSQKREQSEAIKTREAADPNRPKLSWFTRVVRIPLRAAASRAALELAPVDRNDTTRLLGQIGAWSAAAAGVLDVIENFGLFHSVGQIASPSATVISMTAGAAAAKFALLVLPIGLFLAHLWNLARAGISSPACDLARGAVVLPKAASPDSYRWSLPLIDDKGTLTTSANSPDDERYGVCFSGGGIRSATFTLGALQELEELAKPGTDPDRRAWAIDRASFMTAVSGGSYTAAAYQFLARGSSGASPERDERDELLAPGPWRRALERLPFYGKKLEAHRERRSAGLATAAAAVGDTPSLPLMPKAGVVEDHLRRYSSHLADGAAEWLAGIGEVLIRAVTGLLILLLGVWAIGVPLGWAFRYVFHGVANGDASPTIDLRIAAGPILVFAVFVALRLLSWGLGWVFDRRDDHGRRITRARDQARAAASFGVAVVAALAIVLPFAAANVDDVVDSVAQLVGIDSGEPDRSDVITHIDAIAAGASQAATGAAKAAAVVDTASSSRNAPADAAIDAAATNTRLVSERVTIALEQLADEVEPDGDTDDVAGTAFDPETCKPLETVKANPRGVTIRACEAATAARTATDAVGALARALRTPEPAPTTVSPRSQDAVALAVASGAAEATAGSTAAAVALDKLARELAGTAPPDTDQQPPVAWAGLTALVTAIGGLFAKRKLDVASRAKPPAGEKKSNFIAKTVGFGGAVEVLAGVLTVAVLLIAVSDVIEDGWTRGPKGAMEIVIELAAWQWWLAASVALLLITNLINVNTWSLRPFYHRRLWLPYAVTPDGETADWRTDTRLSELGRRPGALPELILCAGAQTSGRDWAPPGRRALSFVFTAEACGGPEIGYVKTRSLERLLGPRHRSPITLFGAVATSGAAFGPAMGRHSKGGIGAVMAIANARLGAWLPNPHHLAQLADALGEGKSLRSGAFARSPRLWYWLMEIIGQYPTDAKLVLTTDGGHVENLGLVELLRRRCTRILCFDASGAGVTPATLAEAIVMAREELNVQVTLLPGAEPPAPPKPRKGAKPPKGAVAAAAALLDVTNYGADPLMRSAGKAEALAARLANRPVLVFEIEYPEVLHPSGTVSESKGWLVYGTLALSTADAADWDLLEYAQRNSIFPGDGTARQWFDAATFSAYQQLGRRTACRMIDAAVEQAKKIAPVPQSTSAEGEA